MYKILSDIFSLAQKKLIWFPFDALQSDLVCTYTCRPRKALNNYASIDTKLPYSTTLNGLSHIVCICKME